MQKSLYIVPLAIIIAGGLIGGGLALGLSKVDVSNSKLNTNTEQKTPERILMRPVTKDDHIRGDNSASLTFVEYSDLECPFCKRFHETMQRVVKEYPGKVRWVYRNFPLTQLHPKAVKEAQAAECAGEQGKFWEYIDRVFEVTPSNNNLDPAQLVDIAKFISIDSVKFTACLDGGESAQKVDADIQDALNIGGRGTPYTIVVTSKGEIIPLEGALPYENIKTLIDSKM